MRKSVHPLGTAANPKGRPGAVDSYAEDNALRQMMSIDIFQDLSEVELTSVMEGVAMKTFKRGTQVYDRFDYPSSLYFLKAGRVQIYCESQNGRKLTLESVEPGKVFGEITPGGRHAAGARAVAAEDSTVCLLDQDDLLSLILAYPVVGVRLVTVMAENLHRARRSLRELAFNDVTGRIADLLLELAGPDTRLIEGYSHEDLASLIGCLRESLTATLDNFKRAEVLAIGRKRIEILDRAHLERVVSQRSAEPRR